MVSETPGPPPAPPPLEAVEQVRAYQQLTDEQLGQLVRAKQGHAPRLLVPKQHHLVQAQALHATAAAAAAKRAAEEKESSSKEGVGSKGIVEQRALIGDSELTCKQACTD